MEQESERKRGSRGTRRYRHRNRKHKNNIITMDIIENDIKVRDWNILDYYWRIGML
uniref:Uncharacterized protein n=1 Tax=viral metagenome TaxID=1070528 RepID=A0A6C0LMW5_9ZZZZ